jgi:predicted molibdopterin-dependent oxidoreductase YjgC
MRVWFLKETKSFCTSCATGCNTVIGTREDVIYRQNARENDHVNSVGCAIFGRPQLPNISKLQTDYSSAVRSEGSWSGGLATAIGPAASTVKQFFPDRDCPSSLQDE